MHASPGLRFSVIAFALAAGALGVQAQQPTNPPPAPPSTTQSQSGYPDVRQEAADRSLFPDPDQVARNLARPSATSSDAPIIGGRGTGQRGRSKKGGLGRGSSQSLVQADADPMPVRVAYRRAKTLAAGRDPHLGVLLRQADLAESDVDKRRYLQAYYAELFTQVERIDSSPAMKSHLASLRLFTSQRYDPKRRAVPGEDDLINGREFGRQSYF